MLAVLVASAALTASQTLLNFARSGPLYVSSAAQRTELEKLCSDAVAEAAEPPAWPRDAALLCQPWDLIATTNAALDFVMFSSIICLRQTTPHKTAGAAISRERFGDTKLR